MKESEKIELKKFLLENFENLDETEIKNFKRDIDNFDNFFWF